LGGSRRVVVSVDGVRVPGVVVSRGVYSRRKCVEYRSGHTYCWEEFYLYTYLPKDLAELRSDEVLVVLKVPRRLLEASDQRQHRTHEPSPR